MEIVGEGLGVPPTQTDVAAWANSGGGLTITTVTDAPGQAGTALRTLGIRETVVILDLRTMQVVYLVTGDVLGIQPSSIGPALAEARRLMGVP